ncbi:hypothetical protein GR28A_00091 [Vibrio phage vB_VcorM_GR28A]|nr:hypothetical protein GR28A_00091 [Vibrio phage vB_VcorM_GR28A]
MSTLPFTIALTSVICSVIYMFPRFSWLVASLLLLMLVCTNAGEAALINLGSGLNQAFLELLKG